MSKLDSGRRPRGRPRKVDAVDKSLNSSGGSVGNSLNSSGSSAGNGVPPPTKEEPSSPPNVKPSTSRDAEEMADDEPRSRLSVRFFDAALIGRDSGAAVNRFCWGVRGGRAFGERE